MKQIFSYETKSASGRLFLDMQESGELFGEDPEEEDSYEYDEPEDEDEDYASGITLPAKVEDMFRIKSAIDPVLEKYGFESFADVTGIHIPRAKMMGPILVGEINAALDRVYANQPKTPNDDSV